MSLYIPQMKQRDTRAYYQNTAKSFLDGVRMQRDYEHQQAVQNNMIESQKMAKQASGRAERQLGLAEEQGARQEQMFNRALDSQKKEEELLKGIVDYKVDKNRRDQQVIEKANQLYDGPIDEKESYWFKPDVHGTDGWEFYQYQPTRKMAEALLKKEGNLIEPKIDENLYKNIQNRKDLGLLDYLQGSSQSLYNNIFGGE